MDQFCSNICSLHNSAIVDACLLLMSKISMEGPDAVFAEKLCSVSVPDMYFVRFVSKRI